MTTIPKVGLAVIILKEGKILFGKRKGALGAGCWGFPGGHVEKDELFTKCAYRENNEETGLKIKLIEPTPVIWTSDFFEKENEQYHTYFMKAKYISGEPKVLEEDKCERWKWFNWSNLPRNLFLPIKNLINQGYNPYQ